MKCGSMKPRTMRRSASTYSRFRYTVSPSCDFPAGQHRGEVVGRVVHHPVAAEHVAPHHRARAPRAC